MLRSYFYKLLRQPQFYLGLAGVLATCVFVVNMGFVRGIDIQTDVTLMLYFGGYRKVFVIFGALPFAANFADEWNSGVTMSAVTRKSARKYAASNIFMCYFSALLTVFLGIILWEIFTIIFSSKPFFIPESNAPTVVGDIFFKMGMPFLAEIERIFIFGSSCGMWAVTGMTLSAFFPSRYIAICSPFVFCYALERISLLLPDFFNLQFVALSVLDLNGFAMWIYGELFFALISALFASVFAKVVERRTQNAIA